MNLISNLSINHSKFLDLSRALRLNFCTPVLESPIRFINKDIFNFEIPSEVLLGKAAIDKNFNSSSLDNLYFNINDLTEEYVTYFDSGIELENYYNPVKNTVNKTIEDTVIKDHGILHLASTVLKDGKILSGFHQREKDTLGFGYGLNEGYTELLRKRYFSDKRSGYYELEEHFANIVEEIVGKDKMQDFYMRADLKGLINELSKEYSADEIQKFIVALDNLSLLSYNRENNSNIFKDRILEKSMYNIVPIVAKHYERKIVKNNYTLESMNEYFDNINYLTNIGEFVLTGKRREKFTNHMLRLGNDVMQMSKLHYNIKVLDKKKII